MFGIGMQELLIVLAVALIVLGPKKLPELARNLGRLFAEFQRAAQDLRSSVEFDDEAADADLPEKKEWEEVKGEETPPGAPEAPEAPEAREAAPASGEKDRDSASGGPEGSS